MTDSRAELVAELKRIRKGRGLSDPQFARRYGPALLAVLGLPPDAPAPEVQRNATELLHRLADQLHDELGLMLLVGFGAHPDARQRFYEHRLTWLATKFQRDQRTVKRSIDDAIELVADLAREGTRHRADQGNVIAQSAWHCRALDTVVVLDGAAPEIIERRRIVSHQDGLDLIELAVTLTASPSDPGSNMASSDDLNVDVLFGGTLETMALESSRRIGLYLRLPAALADGEHADLMLRYRIPVGKSLRPHYVAVPRYRCEHFDLRIRFGQPRPVAAYQLRKLFQIDVDDTTDVSYPVALDQASELRLAFDDLEPGFAYGVRWEPPEPTE